MLDGFLLIGLGLILLTLGAHWLIKGATSLALLLKLTPAVIGLTVVAVGTSLPELFVGLTASLSNHPNLLIGNLIGSNILNIALVIGLSACILPIAVSKQSLRIEWPIMFILTLVAGLFLFNLSVSRWEGGILIFLTCLSTTYFVRLGRKTHAQNIEEETHEVLSLKETIENESKVISMLKALGLTLIGFFLLRFGSKYFVEGATRLAEIWGISERIIGITIVAFGTSLPELMVSLVATFKGRSDLAVGNILGSNIFNLIGVTGICAVLNPFSFTSEILTFDFPALLLITILLFATMLGRNKINRWWGGILLVAYIVYTGLLFR